MQMGRATRSEAIVAAVIDDVVGKLRREYEAKGLIESDMPDSPMTLFDEWLDGVIEADIPEPYAMVVATTTSDGRPSVRAVLMKERDETSLVFYTNLKSRKSREIAANPQAAATFVWTGLHRQVRFEGSVEIVPGDEADRYFSTRGRGSQIAAHASDQSEVVSDRGVLDKRYQDLKRLFEARDIPRPESWGGWRLIYETVEFWQGQPNRFHDRVKYRMTDDGWSKERLAP